MLVSQDTQAMYVCVGYVNMCCYPTIALLVQDMCDIHTLAQVHFAHTHTGRAIQQYIVAGGRSMQHASAALVCGM